MFKTILVPVDLSHAEAGQAMINVAKMLAAAEERNADLIVIASHRPGLQQFLLGSTASRVVRHATCTVLVKR